VQFVLIRILFKQQLVKNRQSDKSVKTAVFHSFHHCATDGLLRSIFVLIKDSKHLGKPIPHTFNPNHLAVKPHIVRNNRVALQIQLIKGAQSLANFHSRIAFLSGNASKLLNDFGDFHVIWDFHVSVKDLLDLLIIHIVENRGQLSNIRM
jgi:hypothetical protein